MKNDLPYRKGVVCIVVFNNKYLLTRRCGWNKNWWKFPQGGIDEGEAEEDTIRRELCEELNIKSFKILMKSNKTFKYDWTENLIKKNKHKWKGQIQSVYLIEYCGLRSEIKISDPTEISEYMFVSKGNINEMIKPKAMVFRGYRDVVYEVLDEYEQKVAKLA
jgi:8-oxo-dGTP pyrophosphatase MutT (NUDIX family)